MIVEAIGYFGMVLVTGEVEVYTCIMNVNSNILSALYKCMDFLLF